MEIWKKDRDSVLSGRIHTGRRGTRRTLSLSLLPDFILTKLYIYDNICTIYEKKDSCNR